MVMYDNEIETKENKILTEDKIKTQHIHNHDFSDVVAPSPFYLVAKPFLWGRGQFTHISGLFLPLPHMEKVYLMLSILPALTDTVRVILPLHGSGVFFLRSLLPSV